MGFLIKEIQKLKLALTTDCLLRCRHCRINKGLGLTMPYDYAQAGVRLLIDSPGKQKRLELYGGEPFLKMPLLKAIVSFAIDYSKLREKELSLSIATNGLLLDSGIIDFLSKNKINLSISVSGSMAAHDSCRVFPNGSGSYAKLWAKLPLVLNSLSPYSLVALQCVAPASAHGLCGDLKQLIAKGFKLVNIECVHGMNWSAMQLKALKSALLDFSNFVFTQIRSHNFIVPEPFIEFFRVSGANTPLFCPMYRDLEMYPDGVYSFYPFAFIDYPKSCDIVKIGDAKSGFLDKYLSCSPFAQQCLDCVSNYYTIPGLSSGAAAYALRTAVLKKSFFDIMLAAKKEKAFAEYALFLAKLKKAEYKRYGGARRNA